MSGLDLNSKADAEIARRVRQAIAKLREKSRRQKQEAAIRLSDSPPKYPLYVVYDQRVSGMHYLDEAVRMVNRLQALGAAPRLCTSRRIIAPTSLAVSP
jgi:hypothetical protein